MRKNLLSSALLLGTLSVSSFIYAQNDRFAFAITDLQSTGSGWNALRKLDLKSGEFTTVLLNGSDATMPAYDEKNNRLYFTPMFIDQLRYIDLKTMKVYYVTDQAFTKLGSMHNDEAKVISRMVINPDGTGYAISNDCLLYTSDAADE